MVQLTNAMVIPNNTRKIQSSPNFETRNFCTRATQSEKTLQSLSDSKLHIYFLPAFARLIVIDLCTWSRIGVSWRRTCGPAPPPVCHECCPCPAPHGGGCDGGFGCDCAHGDCDGGARGGDVHVRVFSAVSPSEGEWPLSSGTHQGAPCTLHIAEHRRKSQVFVTQEVR